ncbi:MAG: hypothetical protein V4726_25270 [Verrucomicrobiota bacterium]
MSASDDFPVPAGRPPLSGAGARLTFLPDPRVSAAAPLLEERLEMAGRQVTGENFGSLLDSLMERMITDAFLDVKADTGLILLRGPDGNELAVAHQVGGAGKNLRGLNLPAGTGRRGLVLASQQPFCGNGQEEDALKPHSLAAALERAVRAEIIVPFYLGRQFKGLIIALQTQPPPPAGSSSTVLDLPGASSGRPEPEGFCPRCLEEIELLSTSLGRLLDYQLICTALGMPV